MCTVVAVIFRTSLSGACLELPARIRCSGPITANKFKLGSEVDLHMVSDSKFSIKY